MQYQMNGIAIIHSFVSAIAGNQLILLLLRIFQTYRTKNILTQHASKKFFLKIVVPFGYMTLNLFPS